ncbi:MAG: hypothetical protein D6685_08305 [Bacteroidetes bacterium]|nr:MAG: hypothetical protein D6685_08305 [Bacteroidota bacterium]
MMTTLVDGLAALGVLGADLFWRPLLAWTVLAVPVYLGLRSWRGAPALLQYRAHLALLLALPLSLLMTPLMPASWGGWFPVGEGPLWVLEAPLAPSPAPSPAPLPAPVGPALPGPSVQQPPGAEAWSLAHLIGVATLIALGMGGFLLARLAYLARRLRAYQASLTPLWSEDVHARTRRLAREMGVEAPVTLLLAPPRTTPMTFGWRAPVIVLPADVLADEEALRMTLVHELIHIRRHDYAVSWLVRVTACLFAVHPGVWLLQRRIEQYREVSCDAEALAGRRVAPRRYAELLLRFSPLNDPAGPVPLRMVELDATLKQRLAAMKSALNPSPRLLRWTLPVAAAVLLIPALLAACSASYTSSETVAVGEAPAPAPAPVAVPEVLHLDVQVRDQVEQALRQARLQAERAAAEADQMAAQVEQERLQRILVELKERGEAARRHVQVMVPAGQEEGRRGDLSRELNRLKIQMTYLEKELKALGEQIQALEARPASERNQVEWALYQQRADLLHTMYRQRLEAYETLKMEAYTDEMLGSETP